MAPETLVILPSVVSDEEIRSVNTDYIHPVLTEDLNPLSCGFNSVIDLSHQTILGSDISDNYSFTWIVIPNDISHGNAIEHTIIGTESPSFNIESSYHQSYSSLPVSHHS